MGYDSTMSTVASHPVASPSNAARPHEMSRAGTIAVWLAGSLIAMFFALLEGESAVLGDYWLPRGNDSFYHARRILDAAVGTRGFYQFDDRLHVPDGSWISWPWAYDYLLAKATQAALWLAPSLDPMAFIAYVPVAWIFLNAALFLATAREIGLSREMQILVMFCFAFSPLTQLLHWIGMVDHHYIESTFVLLCAWLGLRWLKQPGTLRRPVVLGLTLGAATAFHNGLFILQIFPLTAVLLLWLRHAAPPAAELRALAITLVITTLLVLVPSEPFREGMFEFGLHSWFHLYAAGCTALAIAFMSWRAASGKTVGALAAIAVLVSLPLGAQVVGGAGFLSGTFSVLDRVTEVRSPYKMFTETMGPTATAGYYSWLLLLSPVLLFLFAFRALRERRPEKIYFAIFATFGLTLLLMQLRLHYFGYFGLIAGTLLIVDEIRARNGWHRGLVFVAMLAALTVAFQPALRERLFVAYAPSSDPEYAAAFALFLELGEQCAEDPGTVLASSDDGSPILFHTECSVIANNFILRPEDAAHIDEIGRLMRLSPDELRIQRPDIKYLLLRSRDFSVERDGVSYLVPENPIAKQLFIDFPPPPGFTLISGIRQTTEDGSPGGLYARLFKVAN
jgi:hypothetical protein